MRNIRTSLIVGVLVVELVFGVFLLSHKSHRATTDPDVTTSSSVELAAASPQSGDIHVTAGSVVGAAPPSGDTAAAATGAQQSTSGTVVTASDSPAKVAVQVPRLNTRAREPVAVHAYVEPKTAPLPQTESGRDSLHRHGSNPVGAAITDALVKESAKLDPALPPPTQAVQPAQPMQAAQAVPPSLDDSYHRGSNPVAAAMTEQLVRQSAKLDPGLPPPNQASMK
ncbi:MAG: hypothetical protein QOC89_318 [Paraburkholderia sp.]|jgi:hypothetical protein|nr:hypothetical protein [Paraburkholderia sp.]